MHHRTPYYSLPNSRPILVSAQCTLARRLLSPAKCVTAVLLQLAAGNKSQAGPSAVDHGPLAMTSSTPSSGPHRLAQDRTATTLHPQALRPRAAARKPWVHLRTRAHHHHHLHTLLHDLLAHHPLISTASSLACPCPLRCMRISPTRLLPVRMHYCTTVHGRDSYPTATGPANLVYLQAVPCQRLCHPLIRQSHTNT